MNKIVNRTSVPHLSPDMKLYELIDAAPVVLSLISRLGIRLPFGDMSIDELCKRDGRSTELMMMLCAMHIDPTYRPCHEALKPEMLGEVVGYLRASHRYYAERMLPHALMHLEDILEHCDALSQSLLRRFYSDYVTYITAHFEEEERDIFSAIDSVDHVAVTTFGDLEMPHSDIDDRSNDIASLVVKSLPEAAPTALRCAMLKDVYELRDDLRRHSNIEMFLLRPLVEKFRMKNSN